MQQKLVLKVINVIYLVGIPDTNVGMLDDLLMLPFLRGRQFSRVMSMWFEFVCV